MARRRKSRTCMHAPSKPFDKRFPFTVTCSGGRRWDVIVVHRVYGVTLYRPSIILLRRHIHSKEFLDTVIHESLHMALPSATEATVQRTARVIADVVWRVGYRLLSS